MLHTFWVLLNIHLISFFLDDLVFIRKNIDDVNIPLIKRRSQRGILATKLSEIFCSTIFANAELFFDSFQASVPFLYHLKISQYQRLLDLENSSRTKKTRGFLTFSGGVEREYLPEMGSGKLHLVNLISHHFDKS